MYKPLNISFIIRQSKARKNGEVPIYMRLKVDGMTTEVSSGYAIDPSKWDKKTSRVNARGKKARSTYEYLDTLEFKARKAHQELLQKGANITAKAAGRLYSNLTDRAGTARREGIN